MVEQEAVNFEVVSSSLTGGANLKIQTLKVCFFIFPKVRRERSSTIQRNECISRIYSTYTERDSYGKLLLAKA